MHDCDRRQTDGQTDHATKKCVAIRGVSGFFAPLPVRPWLVRLLVDSPPLNTGNSTCRFIVYVFRPRQFMHDDENKRLCEFLML